MNIRSNYMAIVNFTQQIINKNYVKIVIDDRLIANFISVNGYTKSAVDNTLTLNSDIIFMVDAITSDNILYKQITIKSRSNRSINISSI